MPIRVNCYVPISTGIMLEEMKKETEIDKKDLVTIAIRQLYKSLMANKAESMEKNMS